MSSPDHPSWGAPRIAAWVLAAAVVAVVFGPSLVSTFRPPPDTFLDFSQEWLSAKNYWTGTAVYADQTEALRRHTGVTPDRDEDVLPWNAHPPAAVALTIPFGKLDYRDAHLVWNLLTLPLFLASVWLIVRELQFPLRVWSVFPAVVLLLLCNPVFIQLGQGQLNFPILFLITLAWVADRRGRPGWAGVALGVAIGLKLYPGFLFLYFLFARRWRAIFTGIIAFLAVNGVALAVLGLGEFRTYVERVLPSLFGYQSAWRNVTATGFWLRIFDPQPHQKIVPLVVNPTAAWSLILVSRLVVVGVVAWVAWHARTTTARDRAFAAAVVGMLLVAPVAWTHYFVLLALPVGLVWMRLPPGPARWVMWPVLVALWLPENFFALFAVGPEQAQAMINYHHDPLSARVNLLALSVFTYALVALFVLTLLTPHGGEFDDGSPASEIDEKQLNRRLFGPVGDAPG
jgi:hypothetical protein